MAKKRAKKKSTPAPKQVDSTNVKINPADIDIVLPDNSGYTRAMAAEDTPEALAELGVREFPDKYWIEPREWQDFAAENDTLQVWPENWRNRFTHQGNSHECTCHALVQNMEIAWNRQSSTKKNAVWLSPLSVYAEANPRRWGGSSMQYTLGIAIDRGILPSENGPSGIDTQTELYKHYLNETAGHTREDRAGGSWKTLRQFPEDWEDTARHFRPIEVINPRSWEEIICLLLRGIAVSVGRNGHAIPYVQVVWEGRNIYAKYSDSYDVHRYDSQSTIKKGVGGAYAIVTTTIPDDWSAPAGDDMQ